MVYEVNELSDGQTLDLEELTEVFGSLPARGSFAYARGAAKDVDRNALKFCMFAYEKGHVNLVQRRNGFDDFTYIAQIRSSVGERREFLTEHAEKIRQMFTQDSPSELDPP